MHCCLNSVCIGKMYVHSRASVLGIFWFNLTRTLHVETVQRAFVLSLGNPYSTAILESDDAALGMSADNACIVGVSGQCMHCGCQLTMHTLWMSAWVLSNTCTSLSCCSLTYALINFDIHGEDVSVG